MHSVPEMDVPIVSFVGRPLDPNKGLSTFLDALDVLLGLKDAPRFASWIIGGEKEECRYIRTLIAARPALREQLSQGRLRVLGRVSRVALPEFYKRSHLVVMPSWREPFGLVALEAMACGTPLIASRQGGLNDTVLSGVTGTKFEVDHANRLLIRDWLPDYPGQTAEQKVRDLTPQAGTGEVGDETAE